LTPDGRREPNVIGCYRGGFSHWNIKSLTPGLTLRLVHKKRTTERKYQGYRIATKADAQLAGDIPMGQEAGLGGDILLQTENMIAMVAPIEKVAARTLQMQAQTKAQEEGAVQDFIGKGTASEMGYQKDPRRPIRFDEGTRGELER
jgi:hypothetical protein